MVTTEQSLISLSRKLIRPIVKKVDPNDHNIVKKLTRLSQRKAMPQKSPTVFEESNLMAEEQAGYGDASPPWNFQRDPSETLEKHQT